MPHETLHDTLHETLLESQESQESQVPNETLLESQETLLESQGNPLVSRMWRARA